MTSMERSILGTGSRRRGFVRWIFGGILILLLLGIFVVPFVFFGGLARGPLGPVPYYHYAGPFFFFPFGFLFFVLIAFFVVRSLFWGWGWGWRGRGGYRGGWGYGGDAKEILRRRYARGEITKEQFDQMKKDLDGQA
jgi:putative membrane protein